MTDDAERQRASPSPVSDDGERPDAPRPGTVHPHLARERALKVLFAADVRGVDPRMLLDEVEANPADLELLDELEPDQDQVAGDEALQLELTRRSRLPVDDYTRLLVDGVAARRPAIDQLLGEVADSWAVHRMPVVDRNLLRLSIYELAEQDTPHPVVIDEAVSLAIAFAGEKARSFVNGVLETVRQQVVAGEVELTLTPEPLADSSADAADESGDHSPSSDEGGDVSADDTPEDEADEAAHEAYGLALDLLDGEGPLAQDAAADDDPAAEEHVASEDDAGDEDGGGAAVRDEHDALW